MYVHARFKSEPLCAVSWSGIFLKLYSVYEHTNISTTCMPQAHNRHTYANKHTYTHHTYKHMHTSHTQITYHIQTPIHQHTHTPTHTKHHTHTNPHTHHTPHTHTCGCFFDQLGVPHHTLLDQLHHGLHISRVRTLKGLRACLGCHGSRAYGLRATMTKGSSTA